MTADRHQKLIAWMKTRKVATMKALRHQFQISHMTVFRILSEYGYHTSYNRNAAFYALRDVPQFDPAGFWAYRGIRFSRHGSLSDTIVALVENAVAGQTVRELEERLQTRTANLLSRLVRDGRLTQRASRGGWSSTWRAIPGKPKSSFNNANSFSSNCLPHSRACPKDAQPPRSSKSSRAWCSPRRQAQKSSRDN